MQDIEQTTIHVNCSQRDHLPNTHTHTHKRTRARAHTHTHIYWQALRGAAMSLVPPTSSFFMNPPPNMNGSQYNGKIIIASVAMLCFVVLFILALHIYAKWFWRRSMLRQQSLWRRRNALNQEEPITVGLDKAIVDSLPTFIYKLSEVLSKEGAPECAVCLSEFQENDKGRLLPKCNHSFHTDCIDMWFLSHTTCPLCRTSAEPGDAQLLPGAGANAAGVLARPESSLNRQPTRLLPGDAGANLHTPFEPSTREDGDGESLPSPGWRWRRSTSDRFSQSPQAGVQFPTNVLFWGNNSHVSSHASSPQVPPPHLEHGQRGARSLPHMAIEMPRRNMHNVMAPRCASSGASQAYASAHHDLACQQQSKLPGAGLNVFKRLLNRERKVFPTEQEMGSCGHMGGPSSGAMASGS